MTHPYATKEYAASIAGSRRVVWSESLGAWILIDAIPGTDACDASGVYPFICWTRTPQPAQLIEELRTLGVVSLMFVTNPLAEANWTQQLDFSRPYKRHYLVDQRSGDVRFSKHHRYEIRKALRQCRARPVELSTHIEAFESLYVQLVNAKSLGVQHRFSRAHFEHLCDPGRFPAFGAFINDRLASCHVWARHDDQCYSHLAASSAEGYECSASYAVYDCAIEHLADCAVLNLGGAPDRAGSESGLSSFKKGFANSTATNRLCGVVADPARYAQVCDELGRHPDQSSFFPAYRDPDPVLSSRAD